MEVAVQTLICVLTQAAGFKLASCLAWEFGVCGSHSDFLSDPSPRVRTCILPRMYFYTFVYLLFVHEPVRDPGLGRRAGPALRARSCNSGPQVHATYMGFFPLRAASRAPEDDPPAPTPGALGDRVRISSEFRVGSRPNNNNHRSYEPPRPGPTARAQIFFSHALHKMSIPGCTDGAGPGPGGPRCNLPGARAPGPGPVALGPAPGALGPGSGARAWGSGPGPGSWARGPGRGPTTR